MTEPVFLFGFQPAAIWNGVWPRKKIVKGTLGGFLIQTLRNLSEQVLQVFIRLQIVRLGGLNDAVDNCAGFCSVERINKLPVLTANCERTDGTFWCGVINGDQAIVQEHTQELLIIDAVSETITSLTFGGHIIPVLFYPRKERINPGLYSGLTPLFPFFRRKVLKFFVQKVDSGYFLQCPVSKRILESRFFAVCFYRIGKPSSSMSPAAG